jgi:hypothetical protein
MRRMQAWRAVGLVLLGVAAVPAMSTAEVPARRTLEYAPSPLDNPLRGLVPYSGAGRERFPHSLEFNYLPMNALVVGERQYDWSALETLLDEIAGRGHQAVFRVFLEYPGRKIGVPQYLLDRGLTVHRYANPDAGGKMVETPDYENPHLRAALRDFIAAMGTRYDGDPRIGYITAGLLGAWGEWHTYPRSDLWASRDVQKEVLDAYEAAFRKTPVLLRYPAGADDARHTPNAERPFGYHDDSFAWATLETGRRGDSWFYMSLLKAAGPAAQSKWKTQPIGGEIRPEAWGKVFAEDPGDPRIQDFVRCVEETHATWLMDSGMFRPRVSEDIRRRAEEKVRRLGYEFHVAAVTIAREGRTLRATIEVENRGVAPLYHDWRPELALLDASGKAVGVTPLQGRLTGLLPGEPARRLEESLNASELPAGTYQLALRVPNPLPKGNPIRFANASQDAHTPGWLTLVAVTLE